MLLIYQMPLIEQEMQDTPVVSLARATPPTLAVYATCPQYPAVRSE